MSDINDLDVVRRIPDDLRGVVRTFDLRAVPLSKILSATFQAVLQQFPVIRRIDLELDGRRRDQVTSGSSEELDSLPPITDNATLSPPPFQVTDLVIMWSCDEIAPLIRFASSFPLPVLQRLHLSDPRTIGAWPTEEDFVEYRERFEQLEGVAVVWRSLESVQVCIQVLLDWSSQDHEDLTIWNVWQIALTSLFHAFRSNPSCKIGVCITYMFETAATIPLDQTFHRLPDGKRTLCNRMAPTGESDVRDFLAGLTGPPIPRFDLSIKHGEEGALPVELLNVSYHPPLGPSSGIPMEGAIECNFHYERLENVYERAEDEQF